MNVRVFGVLFRNWYQLKIVSQLSPLSEECSFIKIERIPEI